MINYNRFKHSSSVTTYVNKLYPLTSKWFGNMPSSNICFCNAKTEEILTDAILVEAVT